MEIRQLEEEVARLEVLIAQEHAQSRKAMRRSLIVTSALAAMVLLTLLVNGIKFRREFTGDHFRDSLAKELRELSPTALRQLNLLGKEVLPVYTQQLEAQMEKLAPELQAKLMEETDLLVQDILDSADGTLRDSENGLIDRASAIIVQRYPSLEGESSREEIARRLHGILDASLASTLQEFLAQYGAEVETVQGSLLKFDLADTGETQVDLQKKFLHIWLQLLDEEIMAL